MKVYKLYLECLEFFPNTKLKKTEINVFTLETESSYSVVVNRINKPNYKEIKSLTIKHFMQMVIVIVNFHLRKGVKEREIKKLINPKCYPYPQIQIVNLKELLEKLGLVVEEVYPINLEHWKPKLYNSSLWKINNVYWLLPVTV
jgi:hypothetical protein